MAGLGVAATLGAAAVGAAAGAGAAVAVTAAENTTNNNESVQLQVGDTTRDVGVQDGSYKDAAIEGAIAGGTVPLAAGTAARVGMIAGKATGTVAGATVARGTTVAVTGATDGALSGAASSAGLTAYHGGSAEDILEAAGEGAKFGAAGGLLFAGGAGAIKGVRAIRGRTPGPSGPGGPGRFKTWVGNRANGISNSTTGFGKVFANCFQVVDSCL